MAMINAVKPNYSIYDPPVSKDFYKNAYYIHRARRVENDMYGI